LQKGKERAMKRRRTHNMQNRIIIREQGVRVRSALLLKGEPKKKKL